MTQPLTQQTQSSFAGRPFVRDSFTWFTYLLLGYCCYFQAALGPLSTFLQTQFHLSYTSTGIPMSAFAAGMVLTGLIGERVIRPWQRHTFFWIWTGAAGLALGSIFLILSTSLLLAALSTFMMGTFSALTQLVILARLSEHHRERRGIAITEANIICSGCAVLAPLLVGGLQATGLGWRAALCVAVLVLLLTALFCRHITLKETPEAQPVELDSTRVTRGARLPFAFWLYWIVMICSVAVEWSVIVWSATLLKDAGIASNAAAAIVSCFFVAEAGGRLLGSRLIGKTKSTTLFAGALVLTTLGFLPFWLAPTPELKIAGLFLAGLGIANLYPLTISMAIGITPQNANLASARLALGAGLAILGAPLALGRLADMLGIHLAYSLVLVLLFLTGAFIFLAEKKNAHRQMPTPSGVFQV